MSDEMKLTKQKPTEPGLYWCWHEGMKKATACYIERRNWPDGTPELLIVTGIRFRRLSAYTHYAGPVPAPDVPISKLVIEGEFFDGAENPYKSSRALNTLNMWMDNIDGIEKVTEKIHGFGDQRVRVTIEVVDDGEVT